VKYELKYIVSQVFLRLLVDTQAYFVLKHATLLLLRMINLHFLLNRWPALSPMI